MYRYADKPHTDSSREGQMLIHNSVAQRGIQAGRFTPEGDVRSWQEEPARERIA